MYELRLRRLFLTFCVVLGLIAARAFALQVLEVMVSTGRSLAELAADVEKLPQVMINVPLNGQLVDISGSDVINRAVEAVQGQLGDTGRVILRPSGTEPLIRVTLEGTDASQVNRLAEELASLVKSELTA